MHEKQQLHKYIDYTLLKPTATIDDIKTLCREAVEHSFYAVCVNGCFISLAKKELAEAKVKIAAVIGFPLGAMSTTSKIYEAQQCIDDGADEIDMVINIGLLKSGQFDQIQTEIKSIKRAIGNKILKVILETCFLTTNEKKIASQLAINAGADFIKTSTGFGTGGATFDDVRLMKDIAQDKILIKASGGIKDRATAKQYIALGVSRIGTSSGINIILNN